MTPLPVHKMHIEYASPVTSSQIFKCRCSSIQLHALPSARKRDGQFSNAQYITIHLRETIMHELHIDMLLVFINKFLHLFTGSLCWAEHIILHHICLFLTGCGQIPSIFKVCSPLTWPMSCTEVFSGRSWCNALGSLPSELSSINKSNWDS